MRYQYKDKVIVLSHFYNGLEGIVLNENDRSTEDPNDKYRYSYTIRLSDGKEIALYPDEMQLQRTPKDGHK